jgi:WD40 repeat protein
LAVPVVGLFVGVSNYGDAAQVFSTPAHAISAALFQAPFYTGSQEARVYLRNQAILGRPLPIRLAGHSGAVLAAAFSSDDRRIATASADGTVRIWRSDGTPERVLPHGGPVVATTFSRDGTTILTVGQDGVVRLWSVARVAEPRVLLHPEAVRAAFYSADGSRVLTICDDGVARLWSANFGVGTEDKPVAFAGETSCQRPGSAALSPDRQLIAVARCSELRVWRTSEPEEPMWTRRLEGTQTGEVAFSPDSLRIALADADGKLHVLPADGSGGDWLATESLASGFRPLFAADSAWLALAKSQGTAELVRVGGTEHRRLSSDVTMLAISADGQRVLAAGGQKATTHDLAEPHDLSLDLVVPAEWGDHHTRSAALSSNGRIAVLGDESGAAFLLAAVQPPDLMSRFHFTLLADLPSRDSPAGRRLSEIPGAVAFSLSSLSSSRLHGWPDEKDEAVSRTRIRDGIAQTIQTAHRTADRYGEVLLVVYVSAHGRLGPASRPYILSADADATDPSTWISYDEFLEPLRGFLGDVSSSRKRVVIVFDTCQVASDVGTPPQQAQVAAAPGLTVVHAAAPGQYSWHWTATEDVSGFQTVGKEVRWGIPPPPKAQRGAIEKRLATNMSVLPLASQCELHDLLGRRDEPVARGIATREIDDRAWLELIVERSQRILAEIPEVRETGRRQTISVYRNESDAAAPVFVIHRVAAEPSSGASLSPREKGL